MNVHKNARLTPRGRELMISRLERGEPAIEVAVEGDLVTLYTCKRLHNLKLEMPA